jgi:DNA modification methylase
MSEIVGNGKIINITCQGASVMPLDDILDLQGDLKKLTKKNAQKLRESVLKYGFTAPVFIWRDQAGRAFCVDGHQRCKVLRGLRDIDGYSIPDIPVDFIDAKDLPEAKAKLLHISSQYGEFSMDILEGWVNEIDKELSATVRLVDKELDLRTAAGSDTVGDDELKDDVPALTQPGDLWELGQHRLLCGDSTGSSAVEKLLAGVSPMVMVTDPPYGVDYRPEWRAEVGVNKNKQKMGTVQNDGNADWSDAWRLFPGDVAYVWHAGIKSAVVQHSLEKVGFEIRAQIIWAKDRFALSRGHYHWQHEPCWYAVRNKGHWAGDRSQSTLWNIPARDDSGHGHGTQKPLECMRRPIINNSYPGQAVYDPFLGSGTTLIACEKTNRICYSMELDPHYCDVIVRRYHDWCRENDRNVAIKRNGEIFATEELACA